MFWCLPLSKTLDSLAHNVQCLESLSAQNVSFAIKPRCPLVHAATPFAQTCVCGLLQVVDVVETDVGPAGAYYAITTTAATDPRRGMWMKSMLDCKGNDEQ